MSKEIRNLDDAQARALRAAGWTIKSPRFVHGQPVFTAVKPAV